MKVIKENGHGYGDFIQFTDKEKIVMNVIVLYIRLVQSGISYDYFNEHFTQNKLMKMFDISPYFWRKYYKKIFKEILGK